MSKWEDVEERKILNRLIDILLEDGIDVRVYEQLGGFEYYVLMDKGVLGHLWIGSRNKDFVYDYDKGQYYDAGRGLERTYWYYEGKRESTYESSKEELRGFIKSVKVEKENIKNNIEIRYKEYVDNKKISDLEEDFWVYAEKYERGDLKGMWERKVTK